MIRVLGNVLVALNGAVGLACIANDSPFIGSLNLAIFLYHLLKGVQND